MVCAGGEAPAWQMALLEDRVRMLEGRPQLYGTHYDWDDHGELALFPPLEDPAGVDGGLGVAGGLEKLDEEG